MKSITQLHAVPYRREIAFYAASLTGSEKSKIVLPVMADFLHYPTSACQNQTPPNSHLTQWVSDNWRLCGSEGNRTPVQTVSNNFIGFRGMKGRKPRHAVFVVVFHLLPSTTRKARMYCIEK